MKAHPMKARIRNEGSGPARLDVYDDIGPGGWFSDGVTAKDVAGQLAGIKGALDVHISSSGGDVFDGLAIAEAIRAHPGPVTTYVDGIAASIASVIMQAGQKRVMAQGAMAMIHDAWGFPDDCNEAGLLKMAATLGKVSDNLASVYAQRAGGTAGQWRQAMQAETWYTADEAVAAGLADEVAGTAAQLPQGLDVEQLAAHAPVRVMARLRTMPRAAADTGDSDGGDSGGQVCKTCDGKKRLPHPGTGKNSMKCPGCGGTGTYDPAGAPGDDDDPDSPDEGMELGNRGPSVRAKAGDEDLGSGWVKGADGKVRFDPDGDGDDDSTPEGDTDHDYFDEDGKQVKPIPPRPPAAKDEGPDLWALYRMAVRDAGGKVDNSPWDASRAWSAGAASDDPAAFYAGICAGEKAGDKSTQAAWALPYKYAPGDPPNAAGVKAGLAALSGARGGVEGLTNEAEAKKTLQAAMKVVNPDYEPEDGNDKSIFGLRLEQMRGALPPLKGAGA